MTGPEPARGPDAYPGLHEALAAAVRAEFRADVLVVTAADPVFGGPPCAVASCLRAGRVRGLCDPHYNRWSRQGRPGIAEFAASAEHATMEERALRSCAAPGCGYGHKRGSACLCWRHYLAWLDAGKPDLPGWLAGPPAAATALGEVRDCLVPSCGLWAESGRTVFCEPHRLRWRSAGRPPVEPFAVTCEPSLDRIDLGPVVPSRLRMELQYTLQRRSDDARLPTPPRVVRHMVNVVTRSGVASLLDWPEQDWRDSVSPNLKGVGSLAVYGRRQVENLYYGAGWDTEYPRDVWRLRNLGLGGPGGAHVRFDGIPQPWLRELAKRWTRWRLSSGLGAPQAITGARSLARLGRFLDQTGVAGISQVDRSVLERYLAELGTLSVPRRRRLIGDVGTFFQAVRQHHWDASLPPDAMFYREDFPRQPQRLPRALAEHVMAQVEDPANLARCPQPEVRLITVILVRCGLRAGDALALPRRDCIARDGDGAPYLRYYNHKMKREALVPVDDELTALIGEQQQRVLARWPDGSCPHLFPGRMANLDGQRSYSAATYRQQLNRWLADCDIRDEHGQPVHLTPHQWRHTLGTRLINRDVPQHVVQKILDHDSPEMTAHYARLSDTTVRDHWEKARKVDASGQPVQVRADGPLGDAAWSKHRLSRATQALPNGYCQLPLVKTCPHANSCLTCPMFVTTAEFLPQHHAQRQQALQIITSAEANGHARVAEMNKRVASNLDKIITALENGSRDEQPETAGAY